MNADILARFDAAVHALPSTHRVSELRRLWLEAAEASEALSAAYWDEADDSKLADAEDRADETRNALLDHLLTEFGLTTADLKRSVLP